MVLLQTRILKIITSLLIVLGLSTANAMSNEARDWVLRMLQAGQSLNYKGNMVGIRGTNVELMGIVHKIDADGEQERIYSLNGTPREIIRKSGELICYLPDKNMGLQGKLFQDQRFFPAFTDSELVKLDDYYTFQLGQMDRIVGRDAQTIKINPKDEYRYGYQLWIDKETGLLLQSACVDHEGTALERYMFTEVEINIPIDESELEPSAQAKAGVELGSSQCTRTTR